MYSYFAYGLSISSDIAIPEFLSTDFGRDVTISLECDRAINDYVPVEAIDKPLYLKINREEAVIFVKDLALFLVRNGREIVIIPTPDLDESLIRLYIVGTVMAVLLYQRGLLVLHGSVIDINGLAIAILGNSGDGKSSTAAALQKRGHNILTDDVAAVKLTADGAIVFPGFPQIKLSSEAAVSLGYETASLHLIHPSETKRGYRDHQKFSPEPLQLKSVYVLEEDATLDIEIIRPQAAVIELVRHSRPTTLFHSGGAPHFLQCANLAQKITIYRLKRPRCLALLPDLAKLVEAHLESNLHQALV